MSVALSTNKVSNIYITSQVSRRLFHDSQYDWTLGVTFFKKKINKNPVKCDEVIISS